MTTDRDKLIDNLIEYLTDGVSDEPRAIALDVIDLCRNATLDEAIQALKFCDQGEFISVYVRAIEQLKDKDK